VVAQEVGVQPQQVGVVPQEVGVQPRHIHFLTFYTKKRLEENFRRPYPSIPSSQAIPFAIPLKGGSIA
jgi:hypothetical protein